jgi:hypothetical protein
MHQKATNKRQAPSGWHAQLSTLVRATLCTAMQPQAFAQDARTADTTRRILQTWTGLATLPCHQFLAFFSWALPSMFALAK